MFTQNETFLNTMDRLGSRLGPINRVIGTLAERLLPQATAEAACGSGLVFCDYDCGPPCGGGRVSRVSHYARSQQACDFGSYAQTCTTCGYGC